MNAVEFADIINERTAEIIEHHGIRGQRWGIRRFQNSDGTLTDEGKKRYNKIQSSGNVKERKETYKNRKKMTDEELQKKIRRYQLEDQLYDEVIRAQKQYPFTYQQIQTITDEMLKNTRKAEQATSSGKKLIKIFGRKKDDKTNKEKTIEEFVDELMERLEEKEMVR